MTVAANHVTDEAQAAEPKQFEQLDLFTDYDALEKERKGEEEKLSRKRKLQKAIWETARRTDSFVWLDRDRKAQLNERLLFLLENQEQQPECEITFFQPDNTTAALPRYFLRFRLPSDAELANQAVQGPGLVRKFP